jgi:hypothetical protein
MSPELAGRDIFFGTEKQGLQDILSAFEDENYGNSISTAFFYAVRQCNQVNAVVSVQAGPACC